MGLGGGARPLQGDRGLGSGLRPGSMGAGTEPRLLPPKGGSARFPLLEVLFVSAFPLVGFSPRGRDYRPRSGVKTKGRKGEGEALAIVRTPEELKAALMEALAARTFHVGLPWEVERAVEGALSTGLAFSLALPAFTLSETWVSSAGKTVVAAWLPVGGWGAVLVERSKRGFVYQGAFAVKYGFHALGILDRAVELDAERKRGSTPSLQEMLSNELMPPEYVEDRARYVFESWRTAALALGVVPPPEASGLALAKSWSPDALRVSVYKKRPPLVFIHVTLNRGWLASAERGFWAERPSRSLLTSGRKETKGVEELLDFLKEKRPWHLPEELVQGVEDAF